MCFCNLTNMYFSMLPSDYERILKDEIWGMFKHIGIPMETVMSMPIQDRRYYIQKHNHEQEAHVAAETQSKNSNTNTYSGDINEFARMEQANAKVRGGQF